MSIAARLLFGCHETVVFVTVFVVAHGAWSAAWAWKKMRPLLQAAGHAVELALMGPAADGAR